MLEFYVTFNCPKNIRILQDNCPTKIFPEFLFGEARAPLSPTPLTADVIDA